MHTHQGTHRVTHSHTDRRARTASRQTTGTHTHTHTHKLRQVHALTGHTDTETDTDTRCECLCECDHGQRAATPDSDGHTLNRSTVQPLNPSAAVHGGRRQLTTQPETGTPTEPDARAALPASRRWK